MSTSQFLDARQEARGNRPPHDRTSSDGYILDFIWETSRKAGRTTSRRLRSTILPSIDRSQRDLAKTSGL